jgi:hypothetical protein
MPLPPTTALILKTIRKANGDVRGCSATHRYRRPALGEDQRAKPCAHRQTVGTALQSTGQKAPESDNPCDDTPAEHVQLTAAKACCAMAEGMQRCGRWRRNSDAQGRHLQHGERMLDSRP